jgi:hypothetical protein
MGWLSNEIVTQARLPRGAPIPSNCFLDEARPNPSRSPTQIPAAINHTIDAVHLMMQDIFTPGCVHSLQSPALAQNSGPSDARESTQFSVLRTPEEVDQHWHTVLDNLPGEPERLAEALNTATYLNPERLRILANVITAMYIDRMEIERIVNASTNMYAQYDLRQAHPPIPPPTVYHGQPIEADAQMYATPARQQPFHPIGHGQYLTPSASTQPSSGMYGTGSSRHQDSTLTNPSSTFEPTLLSPYSPTTYRRTSLPPGDFENTAPLRRARPSHISLPEAHGLAALPYMHPSVPNTPGDDGVDVFPVPRRLFDRES